MKLKPIERRLSKRSNAELTQTLLDFARRDGNIRAVLREGSGANPNALKDEFSDLDIVFVTRANAPYIKRGLEFAAQFGEIAILQEPDKNDDLPRIAGTLPDVPVPKASNSDVYAYLMQFTDGSRIDLTFNSIDFLRRVPCESATLVLLDKDGMFGDLPAPSDCDYWVQRPSAERFRACCNEFWWTVPYVFKALARGQVIHALEVLNECVRPEFKKMLSWLAGAKTGYTVNIGKHNTDIGMYVDAEFYDALLKSYPHADKDEILAALGRLTSLFPEIAAKVADALGYEYDHAEGERTLDVIKLLYGSPTG
ncbi:MAG: aminoglycoside 6-adenylyltransferase [Clostridiales bacterium]|jgi:aminoglycoside 6-adenylyltransferase|nr:aminoglycoside 6-adenylyltransferase [Clostridiales bacterium]